MRLSRRREHSADRGVATEFSPASASRSCAPCGLAYYSVVDRTKPNLAALVSRLRAGTESWVEKIGDRIQRTNFRAQVPRKRSCSFHGHPACLDPPPSISQGPLGRTTEQSHRAPAQSGGTLGPLFGGPQEFIAVFNELAPTVPRNVTGRTIRVKPGNTLDPINWKPRLRRRILLLVFFVSWQLP
jgi:hypothetical protein